MEASLDLPAGVHFAFAGASQLESTSHSQVPAGARIFQKPANLFLDNITDLVGFSQN